MECQAVAETDMPASSSQRAFQQLHLKSRSGPVAASPTENLVEMWTLQPHLQTYCIRVCITTSSPQFKCMLKYEEPWNKVHCWRRKRRQKVGLDREAGDLGCGAQVQLWAAKLGRDRHMALPSAWTQQGSAVGISSG